MEDDYLRDTVDLFGEEMQKLPSRYEELIARTGIDPLKPSRKISLPALPSGTSTATSSSPRRGGGHRKRLTPGNCVFCKNNNETPAVYNSHVFKDREGRVTCPVLYNYRCPICKATGEDAHTVRYCPLSEENLEKMRLCNAMTKTQIDKGSSAAGQSPPRTISTSPSKADLASSSCSSSLAGDADWNNNNSDSREVKDDILREKILAERLRIDIKELMRRYEEEEDAEQFRTDFLQLPSVQQVVGDGDAFDELKPYMEPYMEKMFKFNVLSILVQRMID